MVMLTIFEYSFASLSTMSALGRMCILQVFYDKSAAFVLRCGKSPALLASGDTVACNSSLEALTLPDKEDWMSIPIL